jgi:hypothetical protein
VGTRPTEDGTNPTDLHRFQIDHGDHRDVDGLTPRQLKQDVERPLEIVQLKLNAPRGQLAVLHDIAHWVAGIAPQRCPPQGGHSMLCRELLTND